MPNIDTLLQELAREYHQASNSHAPFNSAHEGYAVLQEEVEELWDLVKTNPRKFEGGQEALRDRMREEAVQVGAMSLRFINDLCQKAGQQDALIRASSDTTESR